MERDWSDCCVPARIMGASDTHPLAPVRPDLTVAGTGIRISVQSPVLTQVEYTPLPRDMPGTEEPG